MDRVDRTIPELKGTTEEKGVNGRASSTVRGLSPDRRGLLAG